MGSRRRDFHRHPKVDTGLIEGALHNRIAAIDAKPIIPGHYNATLGSFVAATTRHGENLTKAERAKRRSRITLSEVW